MGKNEGPLGRFHLALIQFFSEPLTRRTTVHRQREKWSLPLRKNGWSGTKIGLHLSCNPRTEPERDAEQSSTQRGVFNEPEN